MKWDAGTVLLLVVALAGLGLAVYYDTSSVSAAAGGAALAGAAGLAILLRTAFQSLPRRPRARLEPPAVPTIWRNARLDRDEFARRELYDDIATLRKRVLGSQGPGFTSAEADRLCAAPPEEFRAWVSARLDELEGET